MAKSKFVNDVIEQIVANPRKVLAGHGISGAMLAKIKNREDIFKYLGVTLEKLKTFKRGAMGLKKSPGFMVKVYRNFAELNTKARVDIDNFIGGLKPEDASTFSNTDNIVTVVFDLKDCEVEGTEERAAAGFSKMIKFDSAVKKEYKLPGVGYMVIAYADSLIRTVEEKIAERKASRNERENKREDKPAKIKKALADKKKLAAKIKKVKANFKEKIADNTKELKRLRAQQQRLQIETQQLANAGQNALDRKFKNARTAELKADLEKAVKAAERLFGMLEGSTGKKRLSIQTMISKKNKKIRELRAKLGTYNRLGPVAIAKKADMLHKVQDEIQARIAEGESLSAAMNAALDELQARPAQKQIIKQQVIAQVADGTPMQYAVQQAVQDNMSEYDTYVNKILKENKGLTYDDLMTWHAKRRNYQLERTGNFLDKATVDKVYERLAEVLLEQKNANSVVNEEPTTDFVELQKAVEEVTPVKRKRRTKAEIEKANKLILKAKKAKEREKKKKLREIKAAKKAKLAAKKAKLAAKKTKLAELKAKRDAKKAKKLNTIAAPIDPVVQQILDNDYVDDTYMAADVEPVVAVQTPEVETIDPVVQQILDMDDDYVNPNNEVVPDLNDSPIGTTDFSKLLDLI